MGHFSGAHPTSYDSNACLENLPPRLKYCSLLTWFEARMGWFKTKIPLWVAQKGRWLSLRVESLIKARRWYLPRRDSPDYNNIIASQVSTDNSASIQQSFQPYSIAPLQYQDCILCHQLSVKHHIGLCDHIRAENNGWAQTGCTRDLNASQRVRGSILLSSCLVSTVYL